MPLPTLTLACFHSLGLIFGVIYFAGLLLIVMPWLDVIR
jgi:hypothetical protein